MRPFLQNSAAHGEEKAAQLLGIEWLGEEEGNSCLVPLAHRFDVFKGSNHHDGNAAVGRRASHESCQLEAV